MLGFGLGVFGGLGLKVGTIRSWWLVRHVAWIGLRLVLLRWRVILRMVLLLLIRVSGLLGQQDRCCEQQDRASFHICLPARS